MAFVPPEVREGSGFVPPEAEGFVPPEAQRFVPQEAIGEDPTLGQIGTGLAAEIALAEGAKFAGAAAGAALGPVGAGVGYLAGGLGGGVTGSIAAQRLEGKEDISWGRVAADTVLNLLPLGAGKIKKGSKVLPRLVEGAIKQGAAGSGLAVTGASIEKGIEEGEFLTPEQLLKTAGVGAGLGLGLGALGATLTKSYNKMFAKSPDEIDKLYEAGDIDATNYIDAITGGDPNKRAGRRLRGILKHITPGQVVGKRTSEDVIRTLNEVDAARNTAGKALKQIDNLYKKVDKGDEKLIDDYIEGKANTIPEKYSELKGVIDESRDLITESQHKILGLKDKGLLEMDDAFEAKIRKSVKDGSYLTREYRFYEDPNYKPSLDAERKLRISLAKPDKDGKVLTEAEISKRISELYDSRNNPRRAIDRVAENVKIFKERDVLPRELEEFLGIYERPAERIFGTMQRLGRYAAEQDGALRIAQNLRESGAAVPANRVPEGEDFVQLRIKDIPIALGDEALYVPKDINDSIKQLMGDQVSKEAFSWTENAFTKLLSTTTGLSKFVRVPLAPAAYSPQIFGNAFTIMGMGMNPLRGAKQGLGVAFAEFREKGLPLKEFNRYRKLGLVDKDVRAGDIRASLEKGYDLPILRSGIGAAGKEFTKKVGRAYSGFDTMMRISVFENYKKQLRKMSPDIDKKLNPEQFDRLAAELTNSTYQNYDRINPSLRFLSRIGVLNEFVSFLLELSRTTMNQGKLAKSMIDGSFAKRMKDEFDITIDADAARLEGAKRVSALSAFAAGASAGVYAYNKANGFTDEEMQAIRETVAPEWDDSSALIFTRDGDKIGLTNVAYRFPIADMTSIFQAGLRGESLTDSGSKIFQAIVDKFYGGGTINAKNFMNALQNIDPATGRPIATSPKLIDRIFDQSTYYLTKTFKPGLVGDIQKLDERTPAELGARYLLGDRKFNTDIESGVGFRLRDINKRKDALRIGYSSALYNEKADAGAAYRKFNDDYRANMEQVVRHVKNLRTLGKSDEDIQKILKKGGISAKAEMPLVMRGIVPDMRIAVGVKGNRLDRAKRYADIYSRLPREEGIRMLEQEAATGNINRDTLALIQRISLLKSGR